MKPQSKQASIAKLIQLTMKLIAKRKFATDSLGEPTDAGQSVRLIVIERIGRHWQRCIASRKTEHYLNRLITNAYRQHLASLKPHEKPDPNCPKSIHRARSRGTKTCVLKSRELTNFSELSIAETDHTEGGQRAFAKTGRYENEPTMSELDWEGIRFAPEHRGGLNRTRRMVLEVFRSVEVRDQGIQQIANRLSVDTAYAEKIWDESLDFIQFKLGITK